jgi:hypothetical protein
MATQVLQTLAIYRQEGNDGLIIEREPGEEASMVWHEGAPLCYDISTDATGEIEEYAAGTDGVRIIGVAASHASGTAGTDVSYYEANDLNLFEGSLINGTAAYTLLGTEVGVAYPLVQSTRDWYVDVGNTDNDDVVEVVGLLDAVGDVNPRVIVRFLGGKQSKVLQS